jgi:hypothetical protein
MNIYRTARTKRSARIVKRWTHLVQANNSREASEKALRILKPKAGQAVWVKFDRVLPNT